MWIIREIIVEDGKLEKVLKALTGNVFNMTAPQVVKQPDKSDDAEKLGLKARKPKAKSMADNRSLRAKLIEWLKELPAGTEVGNKQMIAQWVKWGGIKPSVNHALIKGLLDDKIIFRKSRGVYITNIPEKLIDTAWVDN